MTVIGYHRILMTEKRFKLHRYCRYYIVQYDACRKFCESNMSQRTRLCECACRVPIKEFKE